MVNLVCRVSLAGLLAAGCSPQAMPTVEAITKPTVETFARLGSWRPWQSAQAEKPQTAPLVLSDPAPEANKPDSIVREPVTVTRPAPKLTAVAVRAPKPVARPVQPIVPASMPEEPSKTPPALVSCRTHNEPGQRVHMECSPAD